MDFGYHYITRKDNREDGSLRNLSAMVSFQLMDRGIHSETVKIDLTVPVLTTSLRAVCQIGTPQIEELSYDEFLSSMPEQSVCAVISKVSGLIVRTTSPTSVP